jgi:adenine-specific DNA-methyltransferase
MDKLKMHSPDITQQNIDKLLGLFPNCKTEKQSDKGEVEVGIDFDLLKQELSKSIVEGPQERYQLNWPGKRGSLLEANSIEQKTLRPNINESENFGNANNIFIEGNNLTALKLLEETYLGKVKLIYIDPPYNTGGDLIYNDDFSTSINEFYIEDGQKDAMDNRLASNLSSAGRFHTKWLNMLYPRIKKAKNILRPDGVLAVSIDDNELSNLLSILDEIFGWENRKVICVKMSEPSGLKMGSVKKNGSLAKLKEYVVICSPNGISGLDLEDIPKSEWDSEYNIFLDGLTKDDRKVIRNSMSDDLEFTEIEHLDEIASRVSMVSVSDKLKSLGVKKEEKNDWLFDNSWRICQCATSASVLKLANIKKTKTDQENFFVESSTGKIYFVRGGYNHESSKPRLQMLFADENLSVHPGDFWSDIKTTGLDGEGGVSFKNGKKPIKLLSRIINMSTKGKDIVLDFFAGSGSVGEAVWDCNITDGQNRKFILIQYPEIFNPKNKDHAESIKFCSENKIEPNVAELAKQRLRINKTKYNKLSEETLGFRVLKIDSSNMNEVHYTPGSFAKHDLFNQVEHIKADRNAEDLLFQVMLDWGVDLSLPIRKETIECKEVYFVNDDDLVACFDKGIDEVLIKALAAEKPLRVVFRDDGFVSDSVKINVEQIFKQLAPATDIKAI